MSGSEISVQAIRMSTPGLPELKLSLVGTEGVTKWEPV